LAVALAEGYTGQIDLVESMKYFKMASDLGDLKGTYNYGRALEEGWSGEKDIVEAKK
jgi:TPR repeat protein